MPLIPFTPRRLLALACLGFAFGLPLSGAQAEEPFVVQSRPVDDLKAVYGTVEATDTQAARARIGGTVGRLAADEGDEVKDGQVLAVIADPKLALQLQSIEAQVASLKAERAQAVTDLNRTRTLYSQGVVAKARLDTQRTAVEVLDRNIAAQKAQADVITQQAAEGAVKAPGHGRVLQVLVTPGAVVMAGEEVATIASGAAVLRIEVPERHARFIKQGDTVSIGARGLDRSTAAGDVSQGVVAKVYPRLSNGRVVADISADGLGSYFVGERTMVWISTGQRPAILIPPAYLMVRYGITTVTLDDGREVVVQTGQTRSSDDGPMVEILSGLHDGDRLQTPAEATQQGGAS
jgi:RND family efflux transporter MFP subunit